MSGIAERMATEAWEQMKGQAWRNVTYRDLSSDEYGALARSAKARVDATVAAVLRVLAGPMMQNEGYACDYAERLLDWAKEIENAGS